MKDTTIEKRFFSMYEQGGFAYNSLYWVQRQYGLDPNHDGRQGLNLVEIWNYYDDLPRQFKANATWLDEMLFRGSSPIVDEIEKNLDECNSQQETDRYIFSLLIPFKALADTMSPILYIEQREAAIMRLEGNHDEAGSKETIEQYRRDIERYRNVSSRFVRMMKGDTMDDIKDEYRIDYTTDDVVEVMQRMFKAFMRYADRLFAMLAMRGINLKTYQRQAGIYLKQDWSIADVSPYMGGEQLARLHLDQLPQEQPRQQPTSSSDQPLTTHFNSTIDDDTLLNIHEALTNPDNRGNRYLAADTTAAAWLYVCKGTPANAPVYPLNWLADQSELSLLVEKLFGSRWETSKACFRIKGNVPNVKTMATDRSKINTGMKDEPKKHKRLLNILKVGSTARKY